MIVCSEVLCAVCRLYNPNNDVDFTSWFIMCCPIMLINLILCWLSLVFLFIGARYVHCSGYGSTDVTESKYNGYPRSEV